MVVRLRAGLDPDPTRLIHRPRGGHRPLDSQVQQDDLPASPWATTLGMQLKRVSSAVEHLPRAVLDAAQPFESLKIGRGQIAPDIPRLLHQPH